MNTDSKETNEGNETVSKQASSNRINSPFKMQQAEKEIELQRGNAKVTQSGVQWKGELCIMQHLDPAKVSWSFSRVSGEEQIRFGKVELEFESDNIKLEGSVTRIGGDRLNGYFKNGIERGTDHSLDSVTFHLGSFPCYFMGPAKTETLNCKATDWHETKLVANGWKVVLQRDNSDPAKSWTWGALGRISRADGKQFKKKRVKPLLEALRIFLSFAFARWCPPLLVTGANGASDKSWQYWPTYNAEQFGNSRGWVDTFHTNRLVDAFPGFLNLWEKDEWQEPIELAVSWFVEASRPSSSIDGTIANGQIPLEMLAWMKFVDEREIVRSSEFKNLSAISKIQMLLASCDVPFDVPAELENLSSLSSTENVTGPELVVAVRNTTIHPSKTNRKKLAGWADKEGVEGQDIRWQSVLLFREYLTLVLLHQFSYSGEYARRLKNFPIPVSEPVPWAADTTEYKIGRFVRDKFEVLFCEHRLNSTDLDNLCDAEYSKKVFGLHFSLLKRSSDLEDRFDENGHARYYSKLYYGNYLLCSQWYERNRGLLEKWLKAKERA